MKSDETKPSSFSSVVYIGYFEDHAETDSGWELRKNETSEGTIDSNNIEVVETTPTSKLRSKITVHASNNEFSGCRNLIPQSTDVEIQSLLDCFLPDKGDGTLKSRPAIRTRRVSEIMQKLVRPFEQSESTRNEGSASSTSTSASKTVSKD